MTHESTIRYCHEELFPIFENLSEDFSKDEPEYSDTLCKWVTRGEALDMFSDRLAAWLHSFTTEELSEMHSMLKKVTPLDGSDESGSPILQRERDVITQIVVNMVPDDDLRAYAHGLLMHREAYTSPAGLQCKFFHWFALSCYLGLFNLDADERTTTLMYPREQTIAALRYEFEFCNGYLNVENSPAMMRSVVMPFVNGRSLNNNTWVFDDPALLDLIARNAHRVDELILITKTRKTQDPSILQELLESPSYPALMTGRL